MHYRNDLTTVTRHPIHARPCVQSQVLGDRSDQSERLISPGQQGPNEEASVVAAAAADHGSWSEAVAAAAAAAAAAAFAPGFHANDPVPQLTAGSADAGLFGALGLLASISDEK